VTSLLFNPTGQSENEPSDAGKLFGQRYNGRYHLPLLPGERGTKPARKSDPGGNWVPRGVRSATNLAGAIVESRALGIWERELSQIGLALHPQLYERLAFLANKARADGVDFLDMKQHPALRKELESIHIEAKRLAGGENAAVAGTNRHDVWEARASKLGQTDAAGRPMLSKLFGTPEINAQIEGLEALLAANGLERVPGLQERVVRNVALGAAGRFDDVLRDVETGTFYMADLKTKRRAYYTWLEVRIQLAVYATAEYMLQDECSYVPGPGHHVDQEWGIVLRMPADGGAPELRRANLVRGYQDALLAVAVSEARSEGKSVAAHDESVWRPLGSSASVTR
jgi:hypothetical protein